MNAREHVQQLRSTTCACTGKKASRQSFCRGCYFRLPPHLRADLYQGIGEGYEEAYAASLRHLGFAEKNEGAVPAISPDAKAGHLGAPHQTPLQGVCNPQSARTMP